MFKLIELVQNTHHLLFVCVFLLQLSDGFLASFCNVIKVSIFFPSVRQQKVYIKRVGESQAPQLLIADFIGFFYLFIVPPFLLFSHQTKADPSQGG